MSDQSAIDLALFSLRVGLGAVMLAHGVNHVIGGGKIAGTARWFESMGMRQPVMQAWLASATEVAAGMLLIVGLLTPFGGAGITGVMAVAWIINHRTNGFFIFRPGEGYEYVMTLLIAGLAIGAVGPGRWSIDHAAGIDDELVGAPGLAIAAAGIVGAGVLLAAFWRPTTSDSTA